MAPVDVLVLPERKTLLDRFLGLAADVRPGEGGAAVLMAVNGFLLLAAYYTIRPVRSALLLPVEVSLPGGGTLRGPEIQAYSGAVLALLFLFIVPLYSRIASSIDRIRLINTVTLFFVANLIGFFIFGQANTAPAVLGVTFFLWVGIFNLMVMAQFWSFANDLYTTEQGKRLFAIVGFGGSVGAVAGALITSVLIRRLGTSPMMLVAAAFLVMGMLLSNLIHRRDQRQGPSKQRSESPSRELLGKAGGFQLVLRQRYLLLIGLLTFTVQIVNTNGNYILNETVVQTLQSSVDIGVFMAGMDFWQNVLSLAIQFFLVSRIFKYLGIGGALFVLPALALGSYSLIALMPVLSLIRVTKIAENATDYSLQNTLRRALFLPTSRDAKYKALQAVETFFWRAGDMLSAVLTFVVVQWLALSVRGYAAVNLGIVLLWLVIAVKLYRENRRLTQEAEAVAA
ncbi:MAG: NTP/NDP exchange transporter [Vicinamibacterales bacterium]